jgi:hypothetical protein
VRFLLRPEGALLVLLLLAPAAHADERSDLEQLRNTTVNLIKQMVSDGLMSQDKADALLKQVEAIGASPEAAKPAVSVPYVPETVKKEMIDQIRKDVMEQARVERWAEPNAIPAWTRRISFDGDVRFRYQQDLFDPNNAPAALFQAFGQNINNTTEDRSRLRLRARINARARVADTVDAGFGLATGTTGSTGSPNSTNNTLGDSFNRESAGINLAYVRWAPTEWLRMVGGRFENPFLTSDLIWAPDLSFDGVAVSLLPKIDPGTIGVITVGAFPLKETEPNPSNGTIKNKWLYAAQVGVNYRWTSTATLKLGVALYDYKNIEGIPNTDPANPNQFDWTAPQFRQKGNTLFPINLAGNPPLFGLASKFRISSSIAELDLAQYDPVHVTLLGDYAVNHGFDRGEIFQRTGGLDVEPRVTAWQLRAQVGYRTIERRGDWFAFGGYKLLQRDSVLDAFNDGDFYLGGTNAKGWFLGGGWGVDRNAWIGAKYTTANQIDGPPLAIDVFMIDFNASF